MRKFRLTAALMTAVGIATALSVAPINTPAANAATCYATNCAGHDPTTHGCSVSSTVTTNGALATLWNRYSYVCDANWARAQLTATALNAGYSMQLSIATVDRAHNSEYMCWPSPDNDQGFSDEFCTGSYGGSSIAYTDMVDGTNATQAYVTILNSSGDFVAEYEADQ